MEKKYLQENILSKSYNRTTWYEVLRQIFFVKNLNENFCPPIQLAANNIVETALELGYLDTIDERRVGIYEITLKNDAKTKLAFNKVELRRLLQNIYKYELDGALVVFAHRNKWRLSYISEIRTLEGKVETKPKRFTYLFGEGESCKTATDQFEKLQSKKIYLADLYDAFSVEKLNKQFFDGYKAHYQKFSEHLKAQQNYYDLLVDNEQIQPDKAEKPIRDWAKKLLGRIVFLYFLQKKGWLGVASNTTDWQNGDANFVRNLFLNSENKANFYSEILVKLFFNTLNMPRERDIFEITGTKVPYLNGGLFDNDAPQTNEFNFPQSYFENLFSFFVEFNFTIDENSPDDAEIGIDPEMLGHIFENLLEENKDKGTFYTPKDIVKYMCQESIFQYLKPHFTDEAYIEKFVKQREISPFLRIKENAIKLNTLLDNVRICDPAIGSGAFPIGILQEIFEAKRYLFPFLNQNIFDAAEVKLGIIEHSIYGIDLDKGAVDIARLRFWLALVVDEDTPRPLPNLDYKIMQGNSLFDTFEGIDLSKIGTTNDTEVILEEKVQMKMFENLGKQSLMVFSQENSQDLDKLIQEYFKPNLNNIERKVLRNKIDKKIGQKIHASFEIEKLTLKGGIAKQERIWNESGINFEKINANNKDFKKYKAQKELLESFDQREQRIIDLQNKPNEKPYFLWKLYFKEVFDKGGFDIVIGNPPYFSVSKQPSLKPLAERYKTFESTGDIYSLFYERGHHLLRTSGVLVYITGSSWLRSNYGQSLRTFFKKETDPIKLIDLSDCQIFESATVLTTIMAYRKQQNTNTLRALRLTRRTQHAVRQLNNYFETNSILLQSQPEAAWVILDRTRYDLKLKIEEQGIRIKDWEFDINYGIKTGFNEAFILESSGEKDKLIEADPKSAEIIKPLLRGRDVGRYGFNFMDQWLIGTFPALKIEIENYPIIENYLLKFDIRKLQQTGNEYIDEHGNKQKSRKLATNEWFETQDSIAYWQDFEKPKIIYPNMVKDISFAFDVKGFYTNQKCFIMTGEKLKYLLGVLNSKLFRYAFEENFPELQGNSREINKVIINEIPIKVPNEIEEKNISIIADFLLYLYNPVNERVNKFADNKQLAGFFEDIMNHLVCELYFKSEMETKYLCINYIIKLEPIENLKQEEQKEIIAETFTKLQKPGTEVRQCIAMASLELPDSIGQILSKN
jgi:TaqI-like C-terminal specificity domain/Eco57I restriction-modification methylase